MSQSELLAKVRGQTTTGSQMDKKLAQKETQNTFTEVKVSYVSHKQFHRQKQKAKKMYENVFDMI